MTSKDRKRGRAAVKNLKRDGRKGRVGRAEGGEIIRRGGLGRDGLFKPANRCWTTWVASPPGDAPQTSSFFAPINVRSRSAKRAASNGFLNVSLMLDRSKLVELPSSGSKAIRITSANAALRRRF